MGGITNALTTRLGPLPVWVWALIIGGGFLAYKALSGGSAPTGGESVITNPDIDDDDENGDVQLLPIAQQGPNPNPTTPTVPIPGTPRGGFGRRPGMPDVLAPAGAKFSGGVTALTGTFDMQEFLEKYDYRYGGSFSR